MRYVYRRAGSEGAFRLAKEIQGVRLRNLDNQRFQAGDVVICWGETLPRLLDGIRTLNAAPIRNKFQDAVTLKEAGVPTIEVSKTQPAEEPTPDAFENQWAAAQQDAEEFLNVEAARNRVALDAIDGLIRKFTELRAAAARPRLPQAQAIWLPRRLYHTGGTDLLNTPRELIGFWAKKEEFVQEIRVHSFLGKSIRAGVKVPRDGYTLVPNRTTGTTHDGLNVAHPWVRSWDGGWKLHYDGVTSKQKHRDVAHAAVKALGLDFGAADIGERADGTLCVLEVNRAPGLEGGTITAYAKAVERWING